MQDRFIEFVPVSDADSYPVYLAGEPLYLGGKEVSWTVCHDDHVIRISPRAIDVETAIIFARLLARSTYPSEPVGR